MNWVVTEYANSGEIFGVRKAYHATGKSLPIFGERIETPFGPAAGPNSQLAQNIIASYFATTLEPFEIAFGRWFIACLILVPMAWSGLKRSLIKERRLVGK